MSRARALLAAIARWTAGPGASLAALLACAGMACLPALAQSDAPATVTAAGSAGPPAAVRVEVEHNGLYADGRSQARFTATVLDADGAAVADGTAVHVSASGGTLLDAGGTPAQGSPLELTAREGKVRFALIAPAVAGRVSVEVAAGAAKAQGSLDFLPEARDMVAIGVIDGVIGRNGLAAGTITPSNFNDGFEQEIEHWSRALGGNFNASGRTAFFLKGTIPGDALLTAAFDSDKDTRLKLAQTIDPNAVYPVYGDDSVIGFEAQSASHLFVRVDKDHSYLLYGDFSTTGMAPAGSRVSVPAQTAVDRVVLGRYNRSVTGLRGHYEQGGITADGFVIDDTLRQVVEEYPANGTSGPFAVRNGNAVQNSDRVEVIARDKNQRAVIKSVTTLVRYVDYTFEPFSGRILLTLPLPTLTPEGDPNSLRITYEVDQGGSRFFTYGLSGSVQVTQNLRIGAGDVEDRNPLAPSRLASANAELKLTDRVHAVAEVAHTDSTQYLDSGNVYANPTGQSGELASANGGDAQRLEARYRDGGTEARLWWLRADAGFNNPSSGITPGREDGGIKAKTPVAPGLDAYGEYDDTRDTIAQTGREAARIGLTQKLGDSLRLDYSVRNIRDNSGFPPEAVIGPNAAAPGAGGTVTGGFFGNGTSNTIIDPLTGAPINALAPTGTVRAPSPGQALEATTARLEANWQATPRTTVNGAVEQSVTDDDRRSAEAGVAYKVSDKQSMYARAETQTGLASANSLVSADHSNSFVAGATEEVATGTSTFSEYRLVNAVSDNQPSTYDQMLANGLQNTCKFGDGFTATSTAESVKILSGSQREAVAATFRLDYAGQPDWRASGKLEARRLFDDHTEPGDQTQTQYLSTLVLARKLDSDWTALIKNYTLLQTNRDDASGNHIGDVRQERFLAGFAWRPVEDNRINALARYEYKQVGDDSQPAGEHYAAHIAAATMDFHPERAWWIGGRIAAKHDDDLTLPAASRSFNAWLVGARFTYDLTEKVDLGMMASTLRQTDGRAAQSAFGFEAGYRLVRNLWASIGYNWTGFSDQDLAASDYTQRGVYLRLRAKFDESILP